VSRTLEVGAPQQRKAVFPWKVAQRDRNGRPLIVDALGFVVAQVMSGGFAAAENVVANCNRYAKENGQTEI